jgi:spore coat protein U-like protein
VTGSMMLSTANPTQTNTQTVYGQIPASQDAAVANNYSDNVTVTVTY